MYPSGRCPCRTDGRPGRACPHSPTRTRTSTRLAAAGTPVSSATRSRSASPSRRTWVAHAGWSTITTRACASSRTGSTWAASAGPDDLRPAGEEAAETPRVLHLPAASRRRRARRPAGGARGLRRMRGRPGSRRAGLGQPRRPAVGRRVDLGRRHLRWEPGGRWSAGSVPGEGRPTAPGTGRGRARRRRRPGGAPGAFQALGGQLVGGQPECEGQ